MPHYTERPLFDDISDKYLKSRGFVLVRDCISSRWIRGDCVLLLKQDDVISTDEELFRKIEQQAFNSGRKQGKADALTMIYNNLTKIVFPDVKNVDESYS